MNKQSNRLQTAKLNWENNQPVSTVFDDIYYSKESGIEESQYVFLNANNLETRLAANDQPSFTIAETGFGTGLNFLLSWAAWKEQHQHSQTKLNFISFEKFPLRKEDLATALANWPSLAKLSHELLEQYPTAIPGTHRLSFESGDVSLTLYFGDALIELKKACFIANAWYLDGFAPSKNSEMWSDELFEQITSHSTYGTTLSTFTCAGFIRRGLRDSGFNMQKYPGFGRKREMLIGHIPKAEKQLSISNITKRPNNYKIAVIGAGIAGACTAHILAKRGYCVDVFEKHNHIAQEGSGNKQGILYIKPSLTFSKEYEWALTAYQFSRAFYQRIQSQSDIDEPFWHPCGVVNVAWNNEEQERQNKLIAADLIPDEIMHILSSQETEKLTGIENTPSGLFFPKGGWLSPTKACQHLLTHPNIHIETNCLIKNIQQSSDQQSLDQQWHLTIDDSSSHPKTEYYDCVVICCASSANQFEQLRDLPLKKIAGQTTVMATPNNTPNCVVCGDGYLSPPVDGKICFGATFHTKATPAAICEQDHQQNIQKLHTWLPGYTLPDVNISSDTREGHAALRCATPDYQPIAGKVTDKIKTSGLVSKLSSPSIDIKQHELPTYPNLYINIGHGSKGLVSAPLCAEYIADLIECRPPSLSYPLMASLSPDRFYRKQIIQGRFNAEPK